MAASTSFKRTTEGPWRNFQWTPSRQEHSACLIKRQRIHCVLTRGSQVNRRTDLLEWQRCLRAESHVLRKYPHLLVQQSANQPDEVAPSRAAKPRLAAESKKTPWLQLLNKPRHKDPCLVTIQSPPPSETGGTYSVGYSL